MDIESAPPSFRKRSNQQSCSSAGRIAGRNVAAEAECPPGVRATEEWKSGNVQAVIEIEAKRLLDNHLFQRAMGCGHRTSTVLVRVPPKRSSSRSCKTRSISVGFPKGYPPLRRGTESLICDFEPPGLLRDCAGEGAALVAKQFTLEQAAGHCGAVELDERSLPAQAALVKGARHELLASARLSQQEHGRISCSHLHEVQPNSSVRTFQESGESQLVGRSGRLR